MDWQRKLHLARLCPGSTCSEGAKHGTDQSAAGTCGPGTARALATSASWPETQKQQEQPQQAQRLLLADMLLCITRLGKARRGGQQPTCRVVICQETSPAPVSGRITGFGVPAAGDSGP